MTTTQEAGLNERLDAMSAQLAFLVERQRRQGELLEEMTPVLREVMATATSKLAEIEGRGWLRFGAALGDVAARVLDHYTADDVHALGDAIVTILDTVRTLTQPEVLAMMGEAGHVLQHADEAKPIGLVGMVRASRHEEVQKGMAVLMDVLRHVGRAAQAVAEKAAPRQDRKAKLAATLGPRRQKIVGVERAPVPRPQAHGGRVSAPPPSCQVPSARPVAVGAVIDGVDFTAEGHLVDPSVWSHTLAEHIAAVEGITLTPEHWRLVDSARADFEQHKAAANIRRLTQVSGVGTKEIYTLFPKAPGRTIARIAGTPKPAGCI